MARCPFCEYKCGDPSNVARHVATVHHRDKSYKCPHCESVYNRQDNLNMHIKAKHGSLGPKVFQCLQCDFETTKKSNLTRHMETTHGYNLHIAINMQHCSRNIYSQIGRAHV